MRQDRGRFEPASDSGPVRGTRRGACVRAALAAGLMLAASAALGARIGLDPLSGDGAAGRATVLSGDSFDPSTVYAVTVGGSATSPATVTSDAAGVLAPVTLALPALPAGPHDVALTGGPVPFTFLTAYHVERNLCLDPAQGNGMPGATWQTDPALPTGGWSGMVFRLEGTGFTAGAAIAADSITVGGAPSVHPAVAISASGRLPSTTVLVAASLPFGRHDVVVDDGTPTVFAAAFDVRRSLGLAPAMGDRDPGRSIEISGWGFADGMIAADTITVGKSATTHPATAISGGSFLVTVNLAAKADVNSNVAIPGQEIFTRVFHGISGGKNKTKPEATLIPVTLSGLPNETVRIEGLADWSKGTMAADTISFDAGAVLASATRHAAIPVAPKGTFPETWVTVTSPLRDGTDLVMIPDPGGAGVDMRSVMMRRTIGLCPILTGGTPGWTGTVTGYGLISAGAIAANSITAGGFVTSHSATTASADGVAVVPVTCPALPRGPLDVSIDDGVVTVFAGALRARRSIGLGFISGSGVAGDLTDLTGYGFPAGGAIPADSVLFGAGPVTHAAVAVAADGSFAATPLTLPLLIGGPYDVTVQQVFPQAYRVYAPVIEMRKFNAPSTGVQGMTVNYTFSFTNLGVGNAAADNLVLHDTLPVGMLYAPGSAVSAPAAAVEWYDAGCSCWTAVEPAPADVVGIRWTFGAPLPPGGSGFTGFQVTVQ